MKEELNKKIDNAIKLLRMIPTDNAPAEVCYSGGKDSDVILRLAQMAGIKYRAIYKNTTIDPKGTKKHCIDNGAEIINPKLPFFKIVEQRGLPSRWSRHCCSTLKEYKILDYQIIGVRKEESPKRAKLYKEPTMCRNYGKDQHVEQFLPILDWTLADVAEFVERESITLAPHYYTESGNIDFTRRLGCIGCPLQSQKKRIAEYMKNPKIFVATVKAADRFKEAHQRMDIFKTGADMMYYQLFFKNAAEYTYKTNTLFGKIDTRAELERIFNVKL